MTFPSVVEKRLLSNMPRPLELIFGGWKTAGVWTIHDGFPLQFAVTGGGTPIYTYGCQRADIIGKPARSGGPESNWINNYFANPNVFQAPAAYTLGTAARTIGSVRSPFTFTNNLSIMKDFALSHSHEAMKLELRLEAENAFNHPGVRHAGHLRWRPQLRRHQLYGDRATADTTGTKAQVLACTIRKLTARPQKAPLRVQVGKVCTLQPGSHFAGPSLNRT